MIDSFASSHKYAYTLQVLNFAGIKFRDSRISLKTDFSRVLKYYLRIGMKTYFVCTKFRDF